MQVTPNFISSAENSLLNSRLTSPTAPLLFLRCLIYLANLTCPSLLQPYLPHFHSNFVLPSPKTLNSFLTILSTNGLSSKYIQTLTSSYHLHCGHTGLPAFWWAPSLFPLLTPNLTEAARVILLKCKSDHVIPQTH